MANPNNPLVSVIIPVWNGGALLPETLRSLEAQTCRDFEALIVNDGSTDGTAEIARQFCDADPRFQLLNRAHTGLSATRNAGMAAARGEFIAFLDADDLWLPEKLARQMELFRADPRVNFSYTNFYFWDGHRDLEVYYRDTRPLPDGDAARRLVFNNIYGMSSVVVRRELLKKSGDFDPAFLGCEDWDLWLRMTEHGLWARGTGEPLMRYRRWPGNMTNNKKSIIAGGILALEKNLQATRRPELRPYYRRSLDHTRARLELTHAREAIATAPEKVPAALWRAWRLRPGRLKWLMWFLLAVWPGFLGGRSTRKIVHRKLIEKF